MTASKDANGVGKRLQRRFGHRKSVASRTALSWMVQLNYQKQPPVFAGVREMATLETARASVSGVQFPP